MEFQTIFCMQSLENKEKYNNSIRFQSSNELKE